MAKFTRTIILDRSDFSENAFEVALLVALGIDKQTAKLVDTIKFEVTTYDAQNASGETIQTRL